MTAAPLRGASEVHCRYVLPSTNLILCFLFINCLIELTALSLMHHLSGG